MALVTDKSVFLHVAKCGGMWVRQIFKLCKIHHEELGDQHSHFPDLLKLQPPEFFNDRFIFTFVRHPLTWYQSRWAFRVKNGWRAQHPLDYHCASNDFSTFVNNALSLKPCGWVTAEFKAFVDNCPHPIDFVGRIENLVGDTIKALTMAGEKFSQNIIKTCPRTNDSDMGGKSSKYWARYDVSLAKRVLAVEQEIISRYYSDYEFDMDSVCGDRPY